MRYAVRAMFLFALAWGGHSVPVQAQAASASTANADVLGNVKTAIRSGSAKELARYFSPAVDLGVDGDKQSYSPTQAEFVVRDFFSKNPPASFEFVHQGASDAGTPYAIGRYSSKGTSYRVFIKMKNQRGVILIDNLDFTKE